MDRQPAESYRDLNRVCFIRVTRIDINIKLPRDCAGDFSLWASSPLESHASFVSGGSGESSKPRCREKIETCR